MEDKIFNAALAGLLHDVGKVIQRAKTEPWKPAAGVDDSGQPIHATYSIQFIQSYVPKPYISSALAGAYHHRPSRSQAEDKSLSFLVALADKLSAGERDAADEDSAKKDLPKQMVTIFDRIRQPSQPEYQYLPLQQLKLDKKNIFPTTKMTPKEEGDAYEAIKDALESALQQDFGDMETYLENALSTLQRFTWCVPSSYYYDVPDVSLYDHARTTSAIAVCLTDFEAAKVEALLSTVEHNFKGQPPLDGETALLQEPLALLVGGDLSGIQDFIYTVSSKKAAQTLRGRSFYLQLLTEAVLRYVLKELGIPYTCVIYSGGGHFYILAPLSAQEKLPELQQYITRVLLQHHGIQIYFSLAQAKVPTDGFKRGNFPQHWGEMHRQLMLAKQHRYTELGKDALYAEIFQAKKHGGNQEKVCSICGEEKPNVKRFKDEDEGTENNICELCSSYYEQIGKELPHASCIALGLGDPQSAVQDNVLDILRSFGLYVQFIQEKNENIQIKSNILSNSQRVVLWILDDLEHTPKVQTLPATPLYRYTVHQIPPKTFDKLQDEAQGGVKRLGVLRMDVDYLSDIFKNGFIIQREGKEENIATLARLSTLSFLISLYFEGWVKQLCSRLQDQVYAVYAGGDDLFLITPWDLTPQLALDIHNDFKEYVHHNPSIHLSGGMAFIGGKYPLYQAAQDALAALEDAKDIEPKKLAFEGKNAFHFLGKSYHWDEFEQLKAKHERLHHLVTSEAQGGLGGSQSLLQLLQNLANIEKEQRKKTKLAHLWGRWMWMGDYHFRRLFEKDKNPERKQALENINKELRADMYISIEDWGVAARWTQLLVRKENEE